MSGADQVRLSRLLGAVVAQLQELRRLPYLTAVQRAEVAQVLAAALDPAPPAPRTLTPPLAPPRTAFLIWHALR